MWCTQARRVDAIRWSRKMVTCMRICPQERGLKYGFVLAVLELGSTIAGGGVGLWATTQRFLAEQKVQMQASQWSSRPSCMLLLHAGFCRGVCMPACRRHMPLIEDDTWHMCAYATSQSP